MTYGDKEKYSKVDLDDLPNELAELHVKGGGRWDDFIYFPNELPQLLPHLRWSDLDNDPEGERDVSL